MKIVFPGLVKATLDYLVSIWIGQYSINTEYTINTHVVNYSNHTTQLTFSNSDAYAIFALTWDSFAESDFSPYMIFHGNSRLTSFTIVEDSPTPEKLPFLSKIKKTCKKYYHKLFVL